MNAKVIIKEIEKQLVKLDPDNSSKYKANSKKAQSELDNLTKNIKRDLKGNLNLLFSMMLINILKIDLVLKFLEL